MSNNLKELIKYVQAGTAEGDESFLGDVFVPFDQYADVISVPLGGPRIILGNKGSGKSALLRYFNWQMNEIDVPCILVRPKDINISSGNDSSLGSLTRVYEAALLRAIATKLGQGVNGLVINEDDKKLLSQAKSDGVKDEDLIERMVTFLSPIGKKVSGIDFSKLKLGISDVGVKSIKNSIESNLGRNDKCFYVLIDDTDQVAAPNEKDHLNRIWAFLLAARSVMEDCSNVKFIISLRDEVWRRLNRDESGQRDQVDHFRNLISKISLSESEIKSVILKRLALVNEKLGLEPHITQYNSFFVGNHVRIPTTEEEFRYWDDFIVKRSRERPRDSIQLIYKLADYALRNDQEKIQPDSVDKVMPIYSEERVDDLKRESDLECPQIKEVVRAFSDLEYTEGSFTLHPQATADFLNSLTSRFTISLLGKSLRNKDKESVFLLWRFLHEIGFLNARISDSRKDKGFRHITPEEDPDLVSPARWNEMQSLTWEIHPSYRDYLIKVNSEKQFSFGLPKKPKKRGRR